MLFDQQISKWGSLRYASNWAFFLLGAARLEPRLPNHKEYYQLATDQLGYALGIHAIKIQLEQPVVKVTQGEVLWLDLERTRLVNHITGRLLVIQARIASKWEMTREKTTLSLCMAR